MGKPKFKERIENSSLNLENLPWTADRENQARGRWYTVVHKDDPLEWYRPTKVVMDERTVWTLKKYLNDLDNFPQYTHDDMLIKLGHTSAAASWSRYFGPTQNKTWTPAHTQQIQNTWMTEKPGPTQNKARAPTLTQQTKNKWMTEEPSKPAIPIPQLSPIQFQTTVTDVLKSNLHVLEEYKRVVARASKISCDDDDDGASPFVALMG